jgi:hypothetical protein
VEFDLAGGARGEACIDVVEDAGLRKGGLQRLRADGIAFDDSRETDRICGACAQFANDAEMIAAEGTGADDRDADGMRHCHLG